MKFGEKLRLSRKHKGLTQAELAKRSGLSLRTIISYEKGETYPQKPENYLALSTVLGVPGSYLLADDIDGDDGSIASVNYRMAVNRYNAKVGIYLLDGLPDRVAYDAVMAGLADELYREMDGDVFPVREVSSQPVPLTVRPAQQNNLSGILTVWAHARALDKALPSVSLHRLGAQIEDCSLFVIMADGLVCASFVLRFGGEETIPLTEGAWSEVPVFGWLEELVTDGRQMGVYSTCWNFCSACCPNLRAFIKAKNRVDIQIMEDRGFTCCGKAVDENGAELLAFEKVKNEI